MYAHHSQSGLAMDCIWIIILISVVWTCYCTSRRPSPFAINKETGCPYYSKRYIDTCYSVQAAVGEEMGLNFTEARATCFRIGMDLVSWQSTDELDFIQSTIRHFDYNMTGTRDIATQLPNDIKVWTGLQLTSENFSWVNKKVFNSSALSGISVIGLDSNPLLPAPVLLQRESNLWTLVTSNDTYMYIEANAAVCSAKKVLSAYYDALLYFPMDMLSYPDATGDRLTFDVASFQLMGTVPSVVKFQQTSKGGGLFINDFQMQFLNLDGNMCLSNLAKCQNSGFAMSFWMMLLPPIRAPYWIVISRDVGVTLENDYSLRCDIVNGSHQWNANVGFGHSLINKELLVYINWEPNTVKGLEIKIYVNTGVLTSGAFNLYLSSIMFAGPQLLLGNTISRMLIEEFAVWNRALSLAEQQLIFYGSNQSEETTTEAWTTGYNSTSVSNSTTPTPISLEELLNRTLVNISLEEGEEIFEQAQSILNRGGEIDQPGELVSLVNIYSTVGNVDALQNATLESSKSFVQAGVSVANSLLKEEYTNLYKKTSFHGMTSSPAGKIANTTEHLMMSLADKILTNDGESFSSSSDNIATAVKRWDGNSSKLMVPESDSFTDDVATRAFVPMELFENELNSAVVSILYRNLDGVIGSSSSSDVKMMFSHTESIISNSSAKIAVLSRVLSVSITPQPDDSVFTQKPVSMEFETHIRKLNRDVDLDPAVCVYWDTKNSSGGRWSSKGCNLTTHTANYVTCSCSHLTSFAVLTQVKDIEISETNQRALEIASYIGCSLSVAGVILLVATFIFLNIKTERVLVHINLAIAVGLARITFLFLDVPAKHSDACIAVAMGIYYTNQASFFWMLVEGIHLYLQVVVVFNIERSRLKLYMIFAWGVPIILAAVTVGVFSKSIRKSNTCWLQSSDNSIWMFVAPMLAIVVINTCILVRVVSLIRKLSSANATSGLNQAKQVAKATLMLQPVLGLTWVFGMLSLSSDLTVFLYLFTILNSLQGLFLFLFYCVLNSEVQEVFKRRKANWDVHSSKVVPLKESNRSTMSTNKSSGKTMESFFPTVEDVHD
ncbi:adhesion G-protein coupled receptor D1-like [Acanthaster planci]|uniref:Adhesion G-protein coupled receptor D1-like n=1 Tax=Acanthaster planci TaxID=133434 RepID=A0A8B7Z5S0_ACAPL|nr:adhesion G-protein coupled receptor D1-like [Acanthaster planci]